MYTPDPYDGSLDGKSISFKNRNPLNLRPGGGAWQGMVGTMVHPRAGAFVVFDTVENGYRAAAITLINYARFFGARTLRQIVERWAPPAENDTAAYLAKLCADTGFGPDLTLDFLNDPAALGLVMDAMTRIESGGLQPYRAATIARGVELAYRRFGKIVGDWPNSEAQTGVVTHGAQEKAASAAHEIRQVPKAAERRKPSQRRKAA